MATSSAASRERLAADRERRQRSFELNAKQYDFVYDDEHKFCAYIGGIGAGKSFAGAVKALRYMTEHPGSLGAIGAPNKTQLRDSTVRSVLEVFPPDLIAQHNRTLGIISLTNGSEVLLRSMDDPDNRRGPNLAWVWLDEGPLCGYYAWKVMKGRIRQQGMPQQMWITGTPRGEDAFYEDFEHEVRPGHQLYRASTYENAHNLPHGYIEDLGYTGRFAQQEIDGLFVTFEGLVYELRSEWHVGEWEQTHPAQPADRSAPVRPSLRIGGVDWGYTNPAVALPIWVDADDRAFVRDEYYQRQQGLTGESNTVGEGGLSRAILEFTRQYAIQTWYCGPDEPEHISALNAMFGKHKLSARAVAAEDEITAGIETVRRQMALRKDGTTGFKLSVRAAQTRTEMRTYSYATVPGERRDPQEKPIKKFDHGADALRYALHTTLGSKTRTRRLDSRAQEELLARRPISSIGGVTILKRTF